MKLQVYLARLVGICVVPLLLLGAFFAFANLRQFENDQQRAANGLKALAIDGRIQTAAQKHSNYQAKILDMRHEEPAPRQRA